jgi:hypothetical protein
MSVFNSVGTPLVILMVILTVVGAIFGTAVSGADYLNPATSIAEANRMLVDNNHQLVINQESERLIRAETDAQINTIDREQKAAEQYIEMNLNYQQQYDQKRLVIYENFMNVLTNLVWVIGIAAGLVLVLVVGVFLAAKAMVTIRASKVPQNSVDPTNSQSQVPSMDVWQSPEFRELMIRNARNTEAAIRQVKLNQGVRVPYDPASISKEHWEKLPWAQ